MLSNMNINNLENLDVNGQIKIARENTRKWIAVGILMIFCFVLGAVIIISCWKDKSLSDYNLLITPFIGLLGVILGFYFGKDTE